MRREKMKPLHTKRILRPSLKWIFIFRIDKFNRLFIKKIVNLPCLFILPLLVLFAISCATTKGPVIERPKPEPMTLSEKGITITIKYMDENDLNEQFGEKNNPFNPPPSVIGSNRMLVFEVSIDSIHDIKVFLDTIELQFGGKIKYPENQFHLVNYWEQEVKRRDPREYDLGRMRLTIKRNVLPNKLTIKKGTDFKGILVFQGRLPRYGEGKIFFPIYGISEELLHTFKFEYKM
jgi:hypothetical protein